MFPLDLPAAELEDGRAQQHHEYDQRDGGAIAQIEGAEAQLVSVKRQRASAEARTRYKKEGLEHLHRADYTDNHLVNEYGANKRQGDAEEGLPETGPVKAGRLEQTFGHIVDAGQKENDARA